MQRLPGGLAMLVAVATGCPGEVGRTQGAEDPEGEAGSGEATPESTTAEVVTSSGAEDETGEVDTAAASETGGSAETGMGATEMGETGMGDTTAAMGECGDGHVDEGEGCDLSYAENKDAGACTSACQLAYCGDGLIWAGKELCDAGMANNDQTYGGCREDCTPGPRCNDGTLQSGEECDASAPASEGVVPCDPENCRLIARVAFVTSAVFSGDVGGLAGADAACVAAASAAGLDNASRFLAYVGDGGAAPKSRFVDGAKAKGFPYARLDGQKLANDLDDLFLKKGPRVPLEITELGTVLPPKQLAWTGVGQNGEAEGENCEGWSTTYFKYNGQVGQVSPATDSDADMFVWKTNGHWVGYTNTSCVNKPGHLYCFED